MKRSLASFVLCLSILLSVPVVALAQEGEPPPVVEVGTEPEVTPEPPPTEIAGEEPAPPNVDEALDNLLRIVFASAIALFVDAPVTAVIVAVIKRFKQLDFFSARTWATIVAVALWALLTLAQLAGFEVQFNSLLKVVETTLPAVAALFFALYGSGAFYQMAKKADAPIVGYTKPPERQ